MTSRWSAEIITSTSHRPSCRCPMAPAKSSRLVPLLPGSRNIELYPLFCGADVDFIIGGQLPAIPDFRPRLKSLKAPWLVLAGRLRIPRDGEQSFHGIVNTDSTAT